MSKEDPTRILEALETALVLKYRQHGVDLDPSLISNNAPEDFLGAILPSGNRPDVNDRSLRAFDALKSTFSQADSEGINGLALELFRAGVETGRAMESYQRTLSPQAEAELVERDRQYRKGLANLDDEGRQAVHREAVSYAIAYIELMNEGKPMKLDDLAQVTHDHLSRHYAGDHPASKHVVQLSAKGVREILSTRLGDKHKLKAGRPRKE